MKWVVAYDVSDDYVRQRIARALEGMGQRVQGSVFECRFDETDLMKAVERLRTELGNAEIGNVRFYRLCASCDAAAFGFGGLVESTDKEPCIIL